MILHRIPTLEDQIMDAQLERERIQQKLIEETLVLLVFLIEMREEGLQNLRNRLQNYKDFKVKQGVTVINNNNVVNANTSNNASTTTIAPMRDTSPQAGSIPAYG